jgi:hypothetical protein
MMVSEGKAVIGPYIKITDPITLIIGAPLDRQS